MLKMFNCATDEFDEAFVRSHLAFLLEDDELSDISETDADFMSVHYLSYEEENSIYETSKINSSVDITWSSSSTGSISSVKEQESKSFNSYYNSQFPLWSDLDFKETSYYSENSFLKDFPRNRTSTPTKKSTPVHTLQDFEFSKFLEAIRDVESGIESLDEKENVTPSSECNQSVDSIQTLSGMKEVDSIKSCVNYCKFCCKNGEPRKVYKSHVTKNEDGIVVCPILRKYTCTLCGESGDNAHTRRYCRLNIPMQYQKKPLFRRLSNGSFTTYPNHK